MNKNFAIKLVAEEPVTDTENRIVSCDGGGGALGHPKVYINLVGGYTLKWLYNLGGLLFTEELFSLMYNNFILIKWPGFNVNSMKLWNC